MPPREQRVQRALFKEVIMTGRLVITPFLSLRMKKSHDSQSHGSFVISKKLVKLSVGRHLVRRRFYSALRPTLKNLTSPVVLVFFIKKHPKSFLEAKEQLAAVLKKANLLR